MAHLLKSKSLIWNIRGPILILVVAFIQHQFTSKLKSGVESSRLVVRKSLYCYEFNELAYHQLNVLNFTTYSEAWLNFIINCRQGKNITNYDLVIGGVANDKVFNTIELYFAELINKIEAIKSLQYEKPNLQFAFRTNEAIAFLRFKGSIELREQIPFYCKKSMPV